MGGKKRAPSSRVAPPPPAGIPDKPYFRIGEVARLVGVATSVLRFWEGEFARDVRPERSAGGQRVYRRRDVETFLRIKALRRDEAVTVVGAKRRLREAAGEAVNAPGRALAEAVRREIEDLLRVIDEDESDE